MKATIRSTIGSILATALLVMLPGCGKREELPAPRAGRPERIVSLGPAVTRALYLLGAGDRLVGNTAYCNRPPEARAVPRVGNVTEVNVEQVASLEPDLVLAIGLTRPDQVAKLRALGIRVVSFANPDGFDMMCSEFVRLGDLVGKRETAERVVQDSRRRVDRIRNRIATINQKRVFMQIGSKPLFTVTRDSFVNDFIEYAGGVNVAANESSGIYSREQVINDDPEVIIIATMGVAGDAEKDLWMRHGTLAAATNNAVYAIDSYDICSPTPATFPETLEEVAGMIHPGLSIHQED